MITTLFFDLDGTLLQMDEEAFIPLYFKSISAYMGQFGLNGEKLLKTIAKGTKAMFANDGSMTNEERFWTTTADAFDPQLRTYEDKFTKYYQTQFDECIAVCQKVPHAEELVKHAKALGFRIVCASNPVFPKVAMRQRLKWAGIDPDLFDWITSYDTSSFSKSDPRFFGDTCTRLGLKPEECLMLGNNPVEDANSAKAGLHFQLVSNFDYAPVYERLEKEAANLKQR